MPACWGAVPACWGAVPACRAGVPACRAGVPKMAKNWEKMGKKNQKNQKNKTRKWGVSGKLGAGKPTGIFFYDSRFFQKNFKIIAKGPKKLYRPKPDF